MKSISEFFSRIQNKQVRESFVLEIIRDAVKKHSNIDLDLASVSFKGKSVVLKGLGQAAKSQVFVKKPLILNEIGGRSVPRVITDIRFDA